MLCPFEQMHSIDQYTLLRTAEFSREVRQWYEEFQFHKVYQQLVAFSVVDLSAVYFDVLKDRLYTSGPELSGTPFRANRNLADRRSSSPFGGSGDEFHRG